MWHKISIIIGFECQKMPHHFRFPLEISTIFWKPCRVKCTFTKSRNFIEEWSVDQRETDRYKLKWGGGGISCIIPLISLFHSHYTSFHSREVKWWNGKEDFWGIRYTFSGCDTTYLSYFPFRLSKLVQAYHVSNYKITWVTVVCFQTINFLACQIYEIPVIE